MTRLVPLFVLAGCLHTPASPTAPSQAAYPFSLEGHGHRLVGSAIVVHDGRGTVSLEALAPGGIELFSVTARGREIHTEAPSQELEALLDRLPLARDLAVAFAYDCATSPCTAGPWRLRERADRWHVRGPHGPAVVEHSDDHVWVHDGRRGYTLQFSGFRP